MKLHSSAMEVPHYLRGLRPRSTYVCNACRLFSSSPISSSGHSKWSTIKHDKARNDRAKSKERQMVSKEISNATQLWGADPKFNPRLTLALSNAKRASIPKIVIESAIARGQGLSVTGQALEAVTIEAMFPGSVAVVVECRVTMEYREGVNADQYLDEAIEAGAIDIVMDKKNRLTLFTDPADTKRVGETFSKLSGLAIEEREIFWDPNKDTLVEVQDEEHVKTLEDVLCALRENPTVQEIYLNTTESF
ncbi:hypothetical protein N7468_000345 [Penicillium chermesinum]|uniref:DUF28 domain protein n=1 Tax=Penicillium chermesinum TaxID=63820 RepID=A0A9W9PLE9_9EURO|nr:uncharacterized protein N7468_000345 [Penicillium chermesinum]KAJ5248894.1 hypothetical protein N7468_000345 [Penicillium chermesinum]